MIGIYFSGTGNTKYCIEKLLKDIGEDSTLVSIEEPDVRAYIEKESCIVLAYPIQFSNAPIMVRDFIKKNADLWNGKEVLCMATMGGFSGDGAGCIARILKKYGARILGGLHIKMPDSVSDSKLLKKSEEQNKLIISVANEKISDAAKSIVAGNYPKEGLGIFCHIAGLLGQRLWYYHRTLHYSNKLKISDACVGCGKCEKLCPMHNITVIQGKAVASDRCTMCYRCISQCPKKAITLLGNKVIQQWHM